MELKEQEREREEENQRNELRNLIRSGSSGNTGRTVGESSTRMSGDQKFKNHQISRNVAATTYSERNWIYGREMSIFLMLRKVI